MIKRKSAPRKKTTPAKRSTRSVTTKRRSTRRRSLSQNIPVIGNLSIHNPIIGGAIGGIVANAIKNTIPDDAWGLTKSFPEITPYTKAIALGIGAVLLKKYKQPEMSAGVSAVATSLALSHLNIPGLGDNMRSTHYANPNLLLNDTAYLSEDIYPGRLMDYEMLSQSNN